MQSMHVLPQGVGYTYDMDLGVRGSRGKRELALVSMGRETCHTISHVFTTYFILCRSILSIQSMHVLPQGVGYIHMIGI